MKKLKYKIDSTICDELHAMVNKLKYSRAYGDIANLCLLGEKDGLVDKYVYIGSRGGCGGSPSISYTNMDIAFRKMIKEDRIVVGMALIRPTRARGYGGSVMGGDLMENIQRMKSVFADITKTIWLVLSETDIKSYRVSLDPRKRAIISEQKEKSLFMYSSKSKILERSSAFKPPKKRTVKKVVKKKVEPIKEEIKSNKVTNIGNGLVLIKMPDGKELLWTK